MPEPMKPIENPVLVDAMATFKLDLTNREHEMAFLQAAVEARYLIPALVEQAPADTADENGKVKARIAFQIMTNPKGEQFMPAFTDEVELRKTREPKPGEHLQIAVMSFMDLYRFVKANEPIRGVVINPAGSALCLIREQVIAIGDHDGKLSAPAQPAAIEPPTEEEIAQVQAERAAQNRAAQQAAQQAAIRQAMADMEAAKAAAADSDQKEAEEAVTDELIGALKGCLKKQKAVKKAYIQPETDKGEKFLLIAVEADESADIEAIHSVLAEECKDYTDLPFECVPVTSIRAKELIAAEKPFYEKKRFGIF